MTKTEGSNLGWADVLEPEFSDDNVRFLFPEDQILNHLNLGFEAALGSLSVTINQEEAALIAEIKEKAAALPLGGTYVEDPFLFYDGVGESLLEFERAGPEETFLDRYDNLKKGLIIKFLEKLTGGTFWGEEMNTSEKFAPLFGIDPAWYDTPAAYKKFQREKLRIEIKKKIIAWLNKNWFFKKLFGGKKIFAQERYTAGQKVFCCLKEQTMDDDAESKENSTQIANKGQGYDPRVTSPEHQERRDKGKDELWQSANIFLRNMRVVGPRPPTKKEEAGFTPYQRSLNASVPAGVFGVYCFTDPEYAERHLDPNRKRRELNNRLRQDIFTRILRWKKEKAKPWRPVGIVKYIGFLHWTIKENIRGIKENKANR